MRFSSPQIRQSVLRYRSLELENHWSDFIKRQYFRYDMAYRYQLFDNALTVRQQLVVR
jgi:hypothetical protein